MKEFKYLGSLVKTHCTMTGEVNHRIAQVSKVFGELAILCLMLVILV